MSDYNDRDVVRVFLRYHPRCTPTLWGDEKRADSGYAELDRQIDAAFPGIPEEQYARCQDLAFEAASSAWGGALAPSRRN